jgi:RNA polymerase sigma-70 factor (ECF subfamily)
LDRDERELVRRCLQRDEDACAQLVEAYSRMVGTVIWRATGDHDVVEDLAQETFLRAFRGLPYFDQRAKLSTWIYTIAHRVAIDHRRETARRQDGSNEAGPRFDNHPSSELDPEHAASRNELDRIVYEQLGRLPDKYRLPLVYAAIDELDHGTIAQMLKVRRGTVKTLVFRGRQLLKERVDAVLGLKEVAAAHAD